MELDPGFIHIKGCYRFILYSEKEADKYELAGESKHSVSYNSTNSQNRFLLITEPLEQESGEKLLTVRVDVRVEDWRGKVVKVERGRRTEDEAGYENSKNVYVPVAKEMPSLQ